MSVMVQALVEDRWVDFIRCSEAQAVDVIALAPNTRRAKTTS
jgi:hypothetical protein